MRTLRIVYSCPESWETMRGEGAVRHCDRCARTVEDLAERDAADVTERLDRAATSQERACFRVRVDARTGRMLLVTGAAAAALVSMAACTLQMDAPNEPAVHFAPAVPRRDDGGCPEGGCARPGEIMFVGDILVD